MASPKTAAAALYKGLTGGLSIAAESRPLSTRLAAIELRLGSPKTTAQALGVSPQTYRRWLTGKQKPSSANASKVTAAERRARLRPGREANIRNQTTIKTKKGEKKHKLYVSAETDVSGDERPRTDMPVGKDIKDPAVLGTIIDPWLRGDDKAALEALESVIRDYYVSDMTILSITSIDFK